MYKIPEAKIKVTILVITIDIDPIVSPYAIHRIKPVQKITYIYKEISSVDLLFHTFITCGKKALEVHAPAAKPINSYVIDKTFSRTLINYHIIIALFFVIALHDFVD